MKQAQPGKAEVSHSSAESQKSEPFSEGLALPVQRQENRTGMPDNLKAGIENLSGMDMGDVKVHYNSAKPAQLQAHAYAQGTNIHVAPGQERHLPHEAWHVVQQKQGRVRATAQLKGKVGINDNPRLEKEADAMGAKALATPFSKTVQRKAVDLSGEMPVQLVYAARNYSLNGRPRNLHVDHHAVHWGGTDANADNWANRDNRAILFETISTEIGIGNLMNRFGQFAGNRQDAGLSVVLNGFYVAAADNEIRGANDPARNRAVPGGKGELAVKAALDGIRAGLVAAWAGPPINISTLAWERKYIVGGAELEGTRSAVPFASLRKEAASNPQVNILDTRLREKHAGGSVWRKMGDDDLTFPDPAGNAAEMTKLGEVEAGGFALANFVSFGYNLTSVGQSEDMQRILGYIYYREMELRDWIANRAKTYPIEPNTYYKFDAADAHAATWGGMENKAVGGGGGQIKEGLKLMAQAQGTVGAANVVRDTFHTVSTNTDAGGRNNDLIDLLAPMIESAQGRVRTTDENKADIKAAIKGLDQSYFDDRVWENVAGHLMPAQSVADMKAEINAKVELDLTAITAEVAGMIDNIAVVVEVRELNKPKN